MKRSRLERVLGIFTDVRPGEGPTALLMFANVFLILCGYYFIKPLRDGWLAGEQIPGFQGTIRAYSSFAQVVVLVPVVSLYGRMSHRWRGSELITRSTLFCIANLVGFWVLWPGLFFDFIPGSGVVFFLWLQVFSVFVVAQFWTFAADLYTDERGRRLMPLVMIGANAGGALGSELLVRMVKIEGFPHHLLLLMAAVPLLGSIVLTHLAERRGPLGKGFQRLAETPSERAVRRRGSIGTVLSDRFLLLVGLLTLLMFWVITNGENLLWRVIQNVLDHEATSGGLVGDARREFISLGTSRFYGGFYTQVNLATLFLQALVTSRLLKYGGFAAILLALPVVSLGSYATMALVPLVAVIKIMKVAENSTNYSLNNTARHVLWLPATPDMLYKGKPTIDTLFVRAGDGLAALTALVGIQILALATDTLFIVNVVLVLCWLGVAWAVIRQHRRLARSSPRDDEV
jgi:AAA family ATP:ADP antiporter